MRPEPSFWKRNRAACNLLSQWSRRPNKETVAPWRLLAGEKITNVTRRTRIRIGKKMNSLGIRVPVTLKHSRWNGSDSISYVTVPSGCVLTFPYQCLLALFFSWFRASRHQRIRKGRDTWMEEVWCRIMIVSFQVLRHHSSIPNLSYLCGRRLVFLFRAAKRKIGRVLIFGDGTRLAKNHKWKR